MRHQHLSLLTLGLAATTSVLAQKHKPGSFEDGGDTLVSAMMLLVGNEDKVYILDKSENNPTKINGHPAMGAVYDIATRTATPMFVKTNVFCASGMHLPNGSFITLGGNGAVGPGGNLGSENDGFTGSFDATFGDFDGGPAIRILDPCTSQDNIDDPKCQWFDDPALLRMQKRRWYAGTEPLADGSLAIIGGFTNGGYINRNYPNVDPAFEGGAAEPTYEFYPSKGEPQMMQFMVDTSGLNSYALTYLMPSGNMLVQANVSTMLWEPLTNVEHRLPNMPDNLVRVYPASGANAMLPLTPENNWNPTVLFCGGTDMPDEAWGDYSFPKINTFDYPASSKCHRLTPEPTDGSPVDYVPDDDIIGSGRTMGQFIALPDGKLLLVNGAANGTAGYATQTGETTNMPFGMSLAAGPLGQPALYDPKAPAGQRWSNAGFDTSPIPRLYHSSAILLPDASVLIAGSNPNVDFNDSVPFPTTYKAEIFYPSYFSAPVRPSPTGIPATLSYGGAPFDIKVPASSYSGLANDAAANTNVVVIRQGFTTHAMNMGQRFLQLNNTFTVNQDGSYTLHVAQMPPNANIFQPGPGYVYVVVNGIPSNGTRVIVGNGQLGEQPIAPASVLPASVTLDKVSGSGGGSQQGGNNNDTNTNSAASRWVPQTMALGVIAGAVAFLSALGM
ncbi:copper radical oxidase [Cristinia sonorae]|uniref:Copper radical oxidase n=1 Tax=Cristinia sonorae TaxID=1940300 RepID=A0A8K0XQ34_9AGAR|nr:copper radical oxidase [Cristinia sonorae]